MEEVAVVMDGGMVGMAIWMLVWGLVGLAFLAVLVLAAVWLFRRLGEEPHRRGGRNLAEEELKRRYAAGEITREVYLQRRSDISGEG